MLDSGNSLPHDVNAEVAVLGAMLLPQENQVNIPKVMDLLSSGQFYKAGHQHIYDAIADLYQQGESIDYISVCSRLDNMGRLKQAGGIEYVGVLVEGTPEGQHIEHYASIVKEHWVRRTIIARSAEMRNKALDLTEEVEDIISAAGETILDIQQNSSNGKMTMPIRAAVKKAFAQVDELYKSGRSVIGLETGFEWLDKTTTGLHPSDYMLIAGRPSMGKSTLAQNIVQNASIENKIPTIMFSLEMSATSLALRMLSSEAGIDFQNIRTGQIAEREWPALTMAAARISESPLVIDQTVNLTPTEMRNRCYKISSEMKIGLIVVDYVQLLSPSTKQENRNQAVSEISRQLKEIARRFNVPLIAVSQLSRAPEGRTDKRPQLSDLRESGSLEQDADVVVFLFRERYYDANSSNDLSELILAKQRNGPTGVVKLGFDGRRMRFRELGG